MKIELKTGKITPEDYHNLRTAIGWSSYQISEIEEGLKNSIFTIVAYSKEKPIGMGRIIGDGKLVFYIQDIIVLPEFQNKGVGQQLMKKILEFIDLKSVNNSIIGLMASTGKESFYEKFGFIKRPNERMGCGINIWVKKNS